MPKGLKPIVSCDRKKAPVRSMCRKAGKYHLLLSQREMPGIAYILTHIPMMLVIKFIGPLALEYKQGNFGYRPAGL